ncbi:MAG: hypothetical protein WCK65_00900 [Rhodospirillaceae bacterium]
MWRIALTVAAGLCAAIPALAQQQSSDIIERLKATSPAELAAQAREESVKFNRMSPAERAAAEASAQTQVPAIMDAAQSWWATLTPRQQEEYLNAAQGAGLKSK